MNSKIEITKIEDGRYFAEYINPKNIFVNGVGQFGETEFEAEINLMLEILFLLISKKK